MPDVQALVARARAARPTRDVGRPPGGPEQPTSYDASLAERDEEVVVPPPALAVQPPPPELLPNDPGAGRTPARPATTE